MRNDEAGRNLENVVKHYTRYAEKERFDHALGELEFQRTRELLARHLPSSGLVLDIGGGPGAYARWLLERGYVVRLLDPVPRHVEELRAGDRARAEVGDALALPYDDGAADAALLLGPIYHLTSRADRLRALREVGRVLKTGAVLFAAGISRFASFLDGFARRFIWDPAFEKIVRRDLADGRHRNPTGNPDYFTDAFFHHPDELAGEMREAGFEGVRVLAVEGPLWTDRNLPEDWKDEARRALILELTRKIEEERSLLGASPHLLAVATKP